MGKTFSYKIIFIFRTYLLFGSILSFIEFKKIDIKQTLILGSREGLNLNSKALRKKYLIQFSHKCIHSYIIINLLVISGKNHTIHF